MKFIASTVIITVLAFCQLTGGSPTPNLYRRQTIKGDIPFFVPGASGHQHAHHGRVLNTNELDSIATTLGIASMQDLIPKLDKINAYNPGQPQDRKEAGAYLALSMLAKFVVMPPAKFSDSSAASIAYGQLKTQALGGDAKAVRDSLKKFGGDPGKLSDQQLIQLWSGNEHQNLHGILFGNVDIRNAVHATSLSDNNGADKTKTNLGGFNDRGEWPQWGWFEAAKKYRQLLNV